MPSPPAVTSINPTWDNDTAGANFYGTQARADSGDPLSSAQLAAILSPNEAPQNVSQFLGVDQNPYPQGSVQNPFPYPTVTGGPINPLTSPVRPGTPLFYGQAMGVVPQTTGSPLLPGLNMVSVKLIVAIILAMILIYIGLQTTVKNDILRVVRSPK